MTAMRSYVVESYGVGSGVQDERDRARLAAELGNGVRYVRTTFLPGDETLLHLFEATSTEALRDAARDAALRYERIVEAVEEATPPSRQRSDTTNASASAITPVDIGSTMRIVETVEGSGDEPHQR